MYPIIIAIDVTLSKKDAVDEANCIVRDWLSKFKIPASVLKRLCYIIAQFNNGEITLTELEEEFSSTFLSLLPKKGVYCD